MAFRAGGRGVPAGPSRPYSSASATKRTSPAPLPTSSSADFLPCFFSPSIAVETSPGFSTACWLTSSITSPGRRPFSAAGEFGFDAGHQHALDAVLQLERLARIVAERRQRQAERLGGWTPPSASSASLLLRLRHLLLAVLEPAERHVEVDLLALAQRPSLRPWLADRHRGDDARQVAQLLDRPCRRT